MRSSSITQKMKILGAGRYILIAFALFSCDRDETGTGNSAVDNYLDLPKLPYMYYSGKFSDEQIQLGRVLFYDTKLSANGTVSCASCHKQEYAFGDNVAFSKGFN